MRLLSGIDQSNLKQLTVCIESAKPRKSGMVVVVVVVVVCVCFF